MLELHGEDALIFLGLLAPGDVAHRARDAKARIVLRIEDGLPAAEEPAHLARGPHQEKLQFTAARARLVAGDVVMQRLAVIRVHITQRLAQRERPLLRDAHEIAQEARPVNLTRVWVVITGAEARGVARRAQPLLSLAERLRRLGQRQRALLHAVFEFEVDPLEFPCLAVEIEEDAHLGAEDLRHDGHRDIVHGTPTSRATEVTCSAKVASVPVMSLKASAILPISPAGRARIRTVKSPRRTA